MDSAVYNVVYVDRRAREDRIQHREDALPSPISSGSESCDGTESTTSEHEEVVQNLQALLSVFSSVTVCTSGSSCVSVLFDVDRVDPTPTLVLLDIPFHPQPDEELPNHDERHDSGYASGPADMRYGLPLLKFISAELEELHLSNLVMPVVFLTNHDESALESDSDLWNNGKEHNSERRVLKCVDAGAVDVLRSPLTKEQARALYIRYYRATKSIQRTRKRSLLGIEEKPAREAGDFAYLREKMVSELMTDICKPRKKVSTSHVSQIRIPASRKDVIKQAIGRWDFSAHDFKDEELVYCALLMVEHGLSMPEVAEYNIPTEEIIDFLHASRDAYNPQIPYHNFRHVVDVLQAVFYFLLQLRALPLYTTNDACILAPKYEKSLSALLKPIDAFTLLIVAIGHDVGHPGVNNNFLITLKAPLAQVYNDRSVLESFHCAAFSQVLIKYWPKILDLRKMMIEMILATDMGLHFDYMRKLDELKKRPDRRTEHRDENTIAGYKSLICALLIKCADISNVARTHECSEKWAKILIDEFAKQAAMESTLGIPSSLVAPPVTDSVLALAKSQVGFMNIFALPLFQDVTEILPEMQFSVDELNANKNQWESKIKAYSQQPAEIIDRMSGGSTPKSGSKKLDDNLGISELPAGRDMRDSKPARSSPAVNGTSARADGDQTRVTVVVTHPKSRAGEQPINGYPKSKTDDKRPTYQHSSEHLSASLNAETSALNRPRSSPPDLCDSSEHSCTKGCCGTTTVAMERRPSRFLKKLKSWKRRKEHNPEAA
ncbi:3',5'-cyclic-nucleotide phosphodiesterase [Rhizina undulata]